MSPDTAWIALLNAFSLHCGGERVRLPVAGQRLIAFLALNPKPVPRAHAAAALWPDATTDRAAGSLRSLLWRLGRVDRRTLVLATDDLRLADHVGVDVHHTWADAERLLDGRPVDGLDADALAHDILPDWDEEWVRLERDRFRQLRLHALEKLSDRLVHERRYGEAVGTAMIAVAADPLRETAHRALIGAYLAEGNHGEALHQYRACHRLFRDGLGMRPSPALDELINETLSLP
jgi:DNA-binding SARP family transcriptional activator